MDDEKFLEAMKHLIHVSLSKIILSYNEVLKCQPEDFIARGHIKTSAMDIHYLLNHTLIEYGEFSFNKYQSIFYTNKNFDYIKENYIYYIIIKELVEYRKQEIAKNIDHDSLVVDLYKESSIDLNQSDDQYSKYSLISINPNWLKYNTVDAYIYDPRIDKTFIQLHVPTEVSKLLIYLVEEGQLKALAVRPNRESFQEGKDRISILNEEVQFGKVFSLKGFSDIRITKLYSVELNDSLWVAIDDNNITFEEMIEDFNVTDDEEVMTQVVHLEYKVVGEQVLITHIDHEYIYYTLDEYVERNKNFRQKGEARKRVKTLKIDKSEIPFILENDTSLVYTVLKSFFYNHELIDEYFMGIINTNEIGER